MQTKLKADELAFKRGEWSGNYCS